MSVSTIESLHPAAALAPSHVEHVDFAVVSWSAWAPGVVGSAQWAKWALNPYAPTGLERPELAHVTPLLRRRADRLARMALQCAFDVRADSDYPMIFASRYGEVARAMTLLSELSREGRVSPGPFSLSVHNAIAGLYSIAHGHQGNLSAVSAGRQTVEAAIIEASSLLDEGAPAVIITVYEDLRPMCFAAYADEADAAFAWSWRITKPQSQNFIRLQWRAASAAATQRRPTESALPHALEVLNFFLSDQPTLDFDHANTHWGWQRVG